MTVAGPAAIAAVESEVRAIVEAAMGPPDGSVIPAGVAAELARRHGLRSTEELALLALPVARELARAPISGYRVAAVGIEAGSGDLVLGANVEFPGTDLGTTIHAEGFAALRARRRGAVLATLAVRAARPCAHCRQTLAEAAADGLTLIDLAGERRSLDDLYPWAFRPAALDVAGDRPDIARWRGLDVLDGDTPDPEIAAELVAAGSRAHAPYSEAPSAVVLRLADGRVSSAGCVESVAFNPSISAAQAALVEVVAARAEPAAIAEAWLAKSLDGPVDPEPAFRALIGAVAPAAVVRVAAWRPTPVPAT